MHILLCGPSNANTSRTRRLCVYVSVCMRKRGWVYVVTIGYGFFKVFFGEVPTAVQLVWECYTHAQVTQWVKRSKCSSRTGRKVKSVTRCYVECDTLPQLSTASLCSVREACCATVLFSWLRSLDTTSRKARLCTSLWRSSVKQKEDGYFPTELLYGQLLSCLGLWKWMETLSVHSMGSKETGSCKQYSPKNVRCNEPFCPSTSAFVLLIICAQMACFSVLQLGGRFLWWAKPLPSMTHPHTPSTFDSMMSVWCRKESCKCDGSDDYTRGKGCFQDTTVVVWKSVLQKLPKSREDKMEKLCHLCLLGVWPQQTTKIPHVSSCSLLDFSCATRLFSFYIGNGQKGNMRMSLS